MLFLPGGVRRVSVGSALLRAAKEMQERGTFTFAEEAVSFGELMKIFQG
jgi:hypothetical protein